MLNTTEPRHDKTNKMSVRQAKTQISLGIRPVWSESLLSAWRNLGSLVTHWAHSEDWSDWADAQADLSLHWAHSHFVGFVMSRLNSTFLCNCCGWHASRLLRLCSLDWLVYKYMYSPKKTCSEQGKSEGISLLHECLHSARLKYANIFLSA